MDKITLEIDLNEDFDGIMLELAITEIERDQLPGVPCGEIAYRILIKLHHKWVVKIGRPEWSMLWKLKPSSGYTVKE